MQDERAKIEEAFHILNDPKRRKIYDAFIFSSVHYHFDKFKEYEANYSEKITPEDHTDKIPLDYHRIFSILLALFYPITFYILEGGKGILISIAFLIIPFGCIWFEDELGDYLGWISGKGRMIDSKTPGSVIRFLGWSFLIGPILFMILSLLF